MYSVVLLAAISSGEAAPQHGFKKGYTYGACYGGCYGVGYTGWDGHVNAAGGWGLPYGGYWAGYGCFGGCGGYHSVAFGAAPSVVLTPTTNYVPVETKPADNGKAGDKDDKKKKKADDDEQQQVKSRAQVTFELPKGARLFVDGVAIPNADERKSFRTPELRRGEEYYYDLHAEIVRDGKTLTQRKRITLTAGDDLKADFSSLGTTTGVADGR